ncbi:AAEL011107-PA [Aedes aegypti]|uniref:AAEL011107-PA n=1 Tax=Aedes aegypti TaxID=7159 RepID=Q16R17_AEDAE|nr:AAEL011107-PA [Aedes aegypti]
MFRCACQTKYYAAVLQSVCWLTRHKRVMIILMIRNVKQGMMMSSQIVMNDVLFEVL